jgi:pimeloyl-ACP methyl ester carboxylesterase
MLVDRRRGALSHRDQVAAVVADSPSPSPWHPRAARHRYRRSAASRGRRGSRRGMCAAFGRSAANARGGSRSPRAPLRSQESEQPARCGLRLRSQESRQRSTPENHRSQGFDSAIAQWAMVPLETGRFTHRRERVRGIRQQSACEWLGDGPTCRARTRSSATKASVTPPRTSHRVVAYHFGRHESAGHRSLGATKRIPRCQAMSGRVPRCRR